VHLAKDLQGIVRCVKRFDKKYMNQAKVDLLQEECELMRNLGAHPRITAALEIFQDPDFYYIVQEHNAGGDFTKLRSCAAVAGVLNSEAWWRGLFLQCFEGLAHLHKHAVMHCDIKEPNLMLRSCDYCRPEVVIIDFGVSQSATTDRDGTIYGTPGYIPPEVLETKKWFPRSDVFSMGVVLLQMMTDRVLDFDSKMPCGIFTADAFTYRDVAEATRTCRPPFDALPPDFAGLDSLAKNLLEKCLTMRTRGATGAQLPLLHCSRPEE